jgi:hypothetical protein
VGWFVVCGVDVGLVGGLGGGQEVGQEEGQGGKQEQEEGEKEKELLLLGGGDEGEDEAMQGLPDMVGQKVCSLFDLPGGIETKVEGTILAVKTKDTGERKGAYYRVEWADESIGEEWIHQSELSSFIKQVAEKQLLARGAKSEPEPATSGNSNNSNSTGTPTPPPTPAPAAAPASAPAPAPAPSPADVRKKKAARIARATLLGLDASADGFGKLAADMGFAGTCSILEAAEVLGGGRMLVVEQCS